MKKSKINEAIGLCYDFLKNNFPMARFERINDLNIEFVEGYELNTDCVNKVIKIGDSRFHNVNFESDFMMELLTVIRRDVTVDLNLEKKMQGVNSGLTRILASNIIAFDENMNYFANGVVANLFDILIDDDLLYNAYFSNDNETIYNAIVSNVGLDYATIDALLDMVNNDCESSLADIQNTIGISLINLGSPMFDEVKEAMFTEVEFLPSHRDKYVDCSECYDIIDKHLSNRLVTVDVSSLNEEKLSDVNIDLAFDEMFSNEVVTIESRSK